MDELLIEEKKYISSKRAAKITGYAKDYIGQLCREGRVPARLVGRSWYVLETAIKDHKFGDKEAYEAVAPKPQSKKPEPELELAPAEEFLELAVSNEPVTVPRYVPSNDEFLPTLNRLQKIEASPWEATGTEQEAAHVEVQNLQESWKEWFDRAGTTLAAADLPIQEKEVEILDTESRISTETRSEELTSTVDDGERVSMHVLSKESVQAQESLHVPGLPEVSRSRGTTSVGAAIIRFVSILVALGAVSLAVVGSGYLDASVPSVSQVPLLSGISVYNK